MWFLFSPGPDDFGRGLQERRPARRPRGITRRGGPAGHGRRRPARGGARGLPAFPALARQPRSRHSEAAPPAVANGPASP
ncbi:hypothetical protein FDP22_21540 (plasmid) [Paroceanicella profunda]|uniref:Uncharacterized protein n=1 Tax=Paroceanicella profunda TaxID=2579971 RepID=A0A5B8G3H8_9RHOB|nr:hypothetical protein FDP22_21540 [Paroceanicella profunda]